MSAEGWWVAFFDAWYAEARLGVDADSAEVDFLWRALDLAPGARVLDQCCGDGRVARPLAGRGCHVVGVDQSAAYVAAARSQAGPLPCRFEVADAFDFDPAAPVDAAFSWATSFGYSDDDARNAAMLAQAFEALRPGGWFALDYPNTDGVLARFEPCRLERRGGLEVRRDSELDLERGMLRQWWTYRRDGERAAATRYGETRLYRPGDLRALLEATGFGDVRCWGGVDGRPLDGASPRCVLAGRRPP